VGLQRAAHCPSKDQKRKKGISDDEKEKRKKDTHGEENMKGITGPFFKATHTYFTFSEKKSSSHFLFRRPE
jgi:hypothetical protein